MDWSPENKKVLKNHKDKPFDVVMLGLLLAILFFSIVTSLAPALVF